MRNEVTLVGNLADTPQVSTTQSGGKKVSFTLLVRGMYQSFPIPVVAYSTVALILCGKVEEWKKGDVIMVEGFLDFFQGEVVVVAHFVSNSTRRMAYWEGESLETYEKEGIEVIE